MQPSDLARLKTLGDPRLHPDGRSVAFVVSQPDLDEDRYLTRIHLWDGERTRVLTHGPHDARPRWSPEGDRLLFLRKGGDDDDKPQVAVMPADGGEADVVTDFSLGVSEAEWSPDGRRLAVVATTWLNEDLDDDERKRRPKRIGRLGYRGDTVGWRHDRRTHVWIVDVAGGAEPRCLTPGDDFDESGVTWRPDGDHLLFLSSRHADREHEPGTQVFEIAVDSKAPADDERAEALSGIGEWEAIEVASDGSLYLTGLPDVWQWPASVGVYRLADGALQDLTGKIDRSVVPSAPAASTSGPVVHDRGFLTLLEDGGRVGIVDWQSDGPQYLIQGDRCVTGLDASADGRTVVFVAQSATDPGELYVSQDGQERRLTQLNAEFREVVDLVEPIPFSYRRAGLDIDGWVYLPSGDEAAPVLLNIHGGPTSQYGWYFFDEFQVYAGAGFGVVAVNPRGSSGRGTEFAQAVKGVWQDLDSDDMLDLRAAVDEAASRFDRLDSARVGIMGGSYGGFATARILAADQRFSSAVVERGLLSWHSFHGTSDIGPFFDRMFLGVGWAEDPELMHDASPIAVADRVTTPTLVLHSDADYRCPLEQAEQFFTRLRMNAVEAQLLVFPEESHELSRSGKPRHRVERFEAILDWHAEHLE